MRFTERFRGLKDWTIKELCEGREMKVPAENMDIGVIRRAQPNCFLGWAPARVDATGRLTEIPNITVPGIIIMPNQQYAKYMEERRFDRYNNVHSPQEMGQRLGVSILFGIYEPGIRLPGFKESVGENGSGMDLSLIQEATEEGFYTIMGWMDDCVEKLLGAKNIPHTDLNVWEETVTYSLYVDQEYVKDLRPLYYGFVNCVFGCYATEARNPKLDELLM